MLGLDCEYLPGIDEDYHTLGDYEGCVPRWCPGCGDFGILTAVQKLCRDEQLPPEKTVFVSGIGCSSRFPHYMKTYGFHGLHGRAFPIAQGIKARRPDLNVFVNMGDGDCCSIGAGHWLHAIRYNMDMVVILHDNNIYGLTKNQMSPTSPKGVKSNTSPRGSQLDPLNPLSVTLGITNASFVAQTAEWLPDHMFTTIKQAYQHKGCSFVRILQRCPPFMPGHFEKYLRDPNNIMLLSHEDGIPADENLKKIYKVQTEHDPSNLIGAQEHAMNSDKMVLGIFYRNDSLPTYDEMCRPSRKFTFEMRKDALDKEFDKFGIQAAG